MSDFLAALGLVFILEGLLFAAFPEMTKRAIAHALETPDSTLRTVGVVSAILGLVALWLVRG